MAYKHYTDDEQAVALAYLKAAGYPDRRGSLKEAARHTGISENQLRRWFRGENSPPPTNLVIEKVFDLKTAINDELANIFDAMSSVRADASYKDLGTVAAIFTDKLQLLTGKPTARIATIQEELAEVPENERADLIAEAQELLGISAVGSSGSET